MSSSSSSSEDDEDDDAEEMARKLLGSSRLNDVTDDFTEDLASSVVVPSGSFIRSILFRPHSPPPYYYRTGQIRNTQKIIVRYVRAGSNFYLYYDSIPHTFARLFNGSSVICYFLSES